jgi:hypothetical protein
VTEFILKIPYTDFLIIYYVISFIPFFLVGVIFALVFDMFTEHSSKLYCASMFGSGIGSLAAVFFLNFFGANIMPMVGIISSVGALAFASCSKKRSMVASSLTAFLFFLAIFAAGLGGGYIGEINGGPTKTLFSVLKDPELRGRIARTYWSAYSRTDLVELGSSPDIKLIFNDGGAGMEMFRFDGENFDNLAHLRSTSAFFPFYFGRNENVLIIGPGGGKDVLIALMGGAKNIVAVEVNPDIVKIVREESDFNGGIYYRGDVRWVIDEGRSFVKRSNERYDVIMLMLIYIYRRREGSSGLLAHGELYFHC